MDPRDLNRVKNTIGYVEKFVRHNKGNRSKAFEHMVNGKEGLPRVNVGSGEQCEVWRYCNCCVCHCWGRGNQSFFAMAHNG